MPPAKLTADQLRRIEEIDEFQRAADHLKRLVTELEANRAGQTRTIQQLSEKIAHEASQMRQRALTANVGTIAGGTARNVVPDRCTITAEARSRDERKLADIIQEMLDAFSFAAALTECEVETQVAEMYRGYRIDPAGRPVRLAEEALSRAGYEPAHIVSNGGADANVFNLRGMPCVNLSSAMTAVHSPEEHIAVADVEGMVAVALELVEAARTAGDADPGVDA